MVALEERFGTTLDEARAGRRADGRATCEALVTAPPAGGRGGASDAWRCRRGTGGGRRAGSGARAWPRGSCRSRACSPGFGSKGSSTRARSDGPVVFASNHQSHMDTPAILAALAAAAACGAWPSPWRRSSSRRTSFPEGHTLPERCQQEPATTLAALFFNAFPLPQREAGARQTLRYIGELLGEGWSVLIFPEGERDGHRRDRHLPARHRHDWRRGLGVPVVPVRLEGVDRVLHKTWRIPGPAASGWRSARRSG